MMNARCMEYASGYAPDAGEPQNGDWRETLKCKTDRAAIQHPRQMMLAAFLGLPAAVTAGVFLATAVLTLPLALLLGWI